MTEEQPDQQDELFTSRMRKETRNIHSISDALVNAKFAISLQDETVWGGGLFVFYPIFAFLEDAKERLKMPEYDKLFVHNSLFKKKAFEDDLTHYLGEKWHDLPKAEPVQEYLEHLEKLEREDPKRLLAYVYHLYLGLLSGGQILAKKRRVFGEKNNVKDFYMDKVTDFTGADIPQIKKDFRAAMNDLAKDMTEDEKMALLVESFTVFKKNNLIVNSVEGQNKVLWVMLYKASVFIVAIIAILVAYKYFL